MNLFNLEETEGFPFTQKRIKWLQDGYISAFNAIAGIPASAAPVSVVGVKLTAGDWTTGGTVSDGWVHHPDHGLVAFAGGDFTPTTRGIEVVDLKTPLVFKDGSLKEVQIQRVCRAAAGTGSQLQSLSAMRWEIALGLNARTAWVSASATPIGNGTRTISLQYMKDTLTNMLHVRGTISFAAAQSIPDPVEFISAGITLPVGFRPTTLYVFPCFIRQQMVDVPGPNGQITQIQGNLPADGQIGFAGVKPNVGTNAYTAQYYFTIPLF